MEKRPTQSGFEELGHAINPNWKIYVDTCSLYRTMDTGSVFWEKFETVLTSHGCRFIITAATWNEFKKHKHDQDHPASQCAAELEKKLWEFRASEKDLMLTVGSVDEEFHDNAIVAIIKERSRRFNQAYITNDMANAWDVYNVFNGSISSSTGKRLLVYKIGKHGELVKYQELPFLSEMRPDEVKTFFDIRKAAGWEKDPEKKRAKFEEADSYLASHSSFRSPQAAFISAPKREQQNESTLRAQSGKGEMKVRELAGELGVSSKDLLQRLGELGISSKHHASSLSADQVKKVRDSYERSFGKKNAIQESKSLEEIDPPAIIAGINPDYTLPSTGDTLKAVRGDTVLEITLGARIAKGGEGFVYEAQGESDTSDCLAKIYKKSKLYKTMEHAKQRRDKVTFIVENKFDNKNASGTHKEMGGTVKFPLYVLVNENNEFVGYLMKKGRGTELQTLIADGSVESEFRRLYPNIKKTDLATICINFLQIVKSLHARGIVIGDLNDGNILVDTETNFVTLIDADSYQYGETYACDVGVEQYTSPEFLKDHSNIFRTVQNELFVVARIICQILMLIDNPYKSKIARDPIKDMMAGDFMFTFDLLNGSRLTNKEAPDEDLEIRWGQLTKTLKDSFGNTFHHDGKYWDPGNRLDEDFWISALEEYIAEIIESENEGNGFVSNDVFPSTRRAWVLPYKCVSCGKGGLQDGNLFLPIVRLSPTYDDINDIGRHYCPECYQKKIGVTEGRCAGCGEPMLVRENRKESFCQKCVSSGKTIGTCSSCGKEITINVWEQNRRDHYCEECSSKVKCAVCGRELPKHKMDDDGACPNCHKENVVCSKCGETSRVRPDARRTTFICEKCLKKKPCPECGKAFATWILKQNGGKCSNCKDIRLMRCAKCGKEYKGKDQRSAGKDNICQDCWTQVACTECGTRWCPNGTTPLAKWMAAENGGLCSSCAYKKKQEAAKQQAAKKATQATSSSPTNRTSQTSTTTQKKKSLFDILFGR